MMQSAAVLWHVSLPAPEHKALAPGLTGLVRVVPISAFSMLGGVVADALDRRRLMLVTQGVLTLCAALHAWLFMGGPQLGEFEAGLVAQLFGAPVSVITGGIGCLAATALVARRTPDLARHTLDAPALPGG